MGLQVVVLAAGKGTRMKSSLPKVLHPIGGLSLLGHVLKTVSALDPERIIIVLPQEDSEVREAIAKMGLESDKYLCVEQQEALGTANAVSAATPYLNEEGEVLIVCGDTPALNEKTLIKLWEAQERYPHPSIWMFAMQVESPSHYGRVVAADDKRVLAIVEASDATPAQLDIKLCNTGVLLLPVIILKDLITHIQPTPPKNEYYLTDLIHLANSAGVGCFYIVGPEEEFCGVNSKLDLAAAEEILQRRWRAKHMLAGITLMDPHTIYFSYDTVIGADSIIYPHVFFGPGVTLGKRVTIRPYSMLQACRLENDTRVGPCAHLRPGTVLEEGARVGNFVEVKNTTLGAYSHADHLSYLGDSEIGHDVSIGAGTITCNYNGFQKFRTSIGSHAFIGSHTTLVAPITVGEGAMTAAGSVLTKNVSSGALAFARAPQSEREGQAEIFRKKALVAKTKR